MKEFEQLGYQRTMYDKDDLRTSARKVNPKITFSDVQFRKTWDRLEVEIGPGASGTDVKVTPSTAAEYFTQIGPTYNQLKTSDEATQAAQAVQQACHAAAPAAPAAQPAGPAPQPAAPAPQPAPPAPQPAPAPQPTAPAPTPPPQP
jgi:2-oxoglutarate dehydrogenase E2 component (dihydrolipoamide succinyltransferase)